MSTEKPKMDIGTEQKINTQENKTPDRWLKFNSLNIPVPQQTPTKTRRYTDPD